MGVLEGSLSFRTFHVAGEPPNDFHQDYLARLRKYQFEPLSPLGDDERHLGWVTLQQPLEPQFDRVSCFYNQYMIFALRIDKWALPSALLKAHYALALSQRYAPQEAAKLSKRQRDEIKAEVTIELRQKMLPSFKLVDVAWNINERKLRLWSSSQGVIDEFQALFEQTFDIRLDADSPYMMAMDLGLNEQKLSAMLEAKPWHFVAS